MIGYFFIENVEVFYDHFQGDQNIVGEDIWFLIEPASGRCDVVFFDEIPHSMLYMNEKIPFRPNLDGLLDEHCQAK